MKLGTLGRLVHELLLDSASDGRRSNGLWGDRVRVASHLAFKGSGGDGRRAGALAREAALAAIGALTEIRNEATGLARDAVLGVVQGTSGASKSTSPLIREAVEGAIRGSNEVGLEISAAGADAVEGAIEGAVSVGVEQDKAVSEASFGAFEAILDAGFDEGSAAKATIVGVITGVSATGGNVPQFTRNTARLLVNSVGRDPERLAHVSRSVVAGALEVQNVDDESAIECAGATARGAIDAAYAVSEEAGNHTRGAIAAMLGTTSASGAVHLPPPLVFDLAADIAVYHPQGPGVWRAKVLWHAARALVNAGGIDLAASLAFFTLLSFFPLVAIVILMFSAFVEPSTIKTELADIFIFFFPASLDFFNAAVDHLFDASLAVGVVAVVGIVIGANGLNMAANRSVNRIFGLPHRKILSATILEFVVAIGIVLAFLISIGLTVVFQLVTSISAAVPIVGGPINQVIVSVTRVASAVLPLLLTAVVFGIVYRMLPNTYVRWRDATFGAIVAVVLFEIVKHTFFWFVGVTGQQDLIYLPFSSVVLLLTWAFIGGLIFLFGASITKEASGNRPEWVAQSRENGTYR